MTILSSSWHKRINDNNLSKAAYAIPEITLEDILDLSIPDGVYKAVPSTKNLPQTQYGKVEIYSDKTNQWRFVRYTTTQPSRVWITFYNGYGSTVGWNDWEQIATKSDLWPQNPGTKITENTDMYTITTPGHYYCGENAIAASLKNCPCTEAFTLTVYRGAGGPIDGMYTIQEYTSYTGNIRITQTYNMDSKNWTVHKFAFSS